MNEEFDAENTLGVEETDLDPGGGSADEAGDSAELLDEGGSTESLADQTPADPYKERFDALERRYADLETSMKRSAEQRNPPRSVVPDALNKPPEQWTAKDLQEYNQYTIDERLRVVTQEQEWRGKLSAASLGDGNDYDSVVGKLYLNTDIASDPTSLNFIRNLNPVSRYMLSLVHEVHAAAGGDPVKTIKAIRNAIGARMDGARDIQKAVTSQARKTAMGVIRGGQSAGPGAHPTKNAWDLTEPEFRARVAARKG